MKLSDLTEDERAVYLAAFGAFAGSQSTLDRPLAAQARGMRAVRWFRIAQAEQEAHEAALEAELRAPF
jgi:hypothetical protein